MTTRQDTKQICKMHTILNDFPDALYIKIYKDHVFSRVLQQLRGFYFTRVLKKIRTVGRTENDFLTHYITGILWMLMVGELKCTNYVFLRSIPFSFKVYIFLISCFLNKRKR